MAANDEETSTPASTTATDAHGVAALLLVESLIHSLIAQSTLSTEQAIEIIDIAIDASNEIAAHSRAGSSSCPRLLLDHIANDLRKNLRD